MAWDKNLDVDKPPDTGESPSLGASRIRDFKNAVCERLTNWLHGFKTDDTETKEGLKKAPFNVGDAPSEEADKVIVYAKDVAGVAELFAKDENGVEYQLHPRGIIVMWSGTIATIPTGWALCDGNNGTPNLLDRFILGVPSAEEDPGGSGGAHTKTIATANLPPHTHGSAGNHKHYINRGKRSDVSGLFIWGIGEETTSSIFTSESGAHTHASVGSGKALDIKPKYYKLAYIMKL